MKKILGVLTLALVLMVSTCLNVKAEELNVMVRQNKWLEYWNYGLSNRNHSGWGTYMYEISVDGGKTWTYSYCLNTNLIEPLDDFFNNKVENYDAFFNNENIQKILYYGVNKDDWDKEGYAKISEKYGLYIVDTNPPDPKNPYKLDYSDEMLYIITHVTVSYAYYHDVLGLSEDDAAARTLAYIAETYAPFPEDAECPTYKDCTYGQSYVKELYKYLTSKPSIGISLKYEDGTSVRALDITSKNLRVNEYIKIEGGDISAKNGGRVEFTIPENMKCEVLGEQTGGSAPGIYYSGDKLVLGSGQSFKLSLTKSVNSLGTIKLDVYNNSNVIVIDGGKDKYGDDAQDIGAIYSSTYVPNNLEVVIEGSTEVLKNPETGISSYTYLIVVALSAFAVLVIGRRYNRFSTSL